MSERTYYDILGVSQHASLDEITRAKNSLAKVYHPDANIHNNIDTTAYMQEILEAYRTLSDSESRETYDRKISDNKRVFRTFSMKDTEDSGARTSQTSFVTYWNAVNTLSEVVKEGADLKYDKELLPGLAGQAIHCIILLETAAIARKYWHMDAMNWVLLRWGQNQDSDYRYWFSKYDYYIESRKSGTEKLRMKMEQQKFQRNLKKLLKLSSKI